jgi:WD40 repeat protein
MCLYDLRRSASFSSRQSTAASTCTQPLLSYAGHVNTFSHIKPTVDADEQWLFCGGEDGLMRTWDVRHGNLIMSASPIPPDGAVASSSSMRSSSQARRSAWKHVLYIDQLETLLAGSDVGVAAMTMHR